MLPFVLPFGLFMLATMLESYWVDMGVYEWAYAGKLVIVGAAWIWGRRYYPSWNTKGLLWGVGFGIVGTVAWVGLATLNLESSIQEWLPNFLKAGPRAGYNPYGEGDSITMSAALFVVVRLIGLIAIVPLMEEVFWRGFLMPYFVDPDFEKVPAGAFSPFGFAFVTVAFVLVHNEWSAALIWGLGINFLYVWKKNLWACVVMHMTTNALLGVWILQTKTWHLW